MYIYTCSVQHSFKAIDRLIHFTVRVVYTASVARHRRLTNGITVICITHGFMDGLGNNGFTNPIISSCLQISSIYNPFSSRFSFPVAFHHCNIYRLNGLHNKPPLLLPGNHARMQNSWNISYLRLFLH